MSYNIVQNDGTLKNIAGGESKNIINDDIVSKETTYSSEMITKLINETQKATEAVQLINTGTRARDIAFVSEHSDTIIYNNKEYNCYKSISECINTEYENLDTTLYIGLNVIVLEGTYFENVRLYGKKNIAIIGVSNQACRVINYEDEEKNGYYYPPFWINPSTTIMNLWIETRDKYTPDHQAYCIHTDDDGTGPVLIKNCVLVCYQHACVGFGTRQNAPLFIEDCSMVNNSTRGNGGALLYGHNSYGGGSTREELHVSRCYGRTAGVDPLDIFNANHFYPGGDATSNDFLLYFNDNEFYKGNTTISEIICWNEDYMRPTADNVNYISSFMRRATSNSGNNMNILNYPITNISAVNKSDANDCYPETDGEMTYRCDVSAANLPTSDSTHWIIKSYRYDNQLGIQIAYATHKDLVYMRRFYLGEFQPWMRITLS